LPRAPPISPTFPYTTLFRSRKTNKMPKANRPPLRGVPRWVTETPEGMTYHLGMFNRGFEEQVIQLTRAEFKELKRCLSKSRKHQDRKSTRLNSSHLVISYAV